ncbi:MAG: succinate dehydrogenase assembly factor 2 [Rhodospirillales bacterium]|nr:succinate dehydrogenase assembly factor 2 [Rhodospirillales bacterium]
MILEIRHRTIKRLRYRAWHRGTRELDLLIGRFADAHLEALDDGQLHRFELLLNQSDPDMYDWILERRIAPPVQQCDVLSLLIAFNKT